MFLPDKKDAIHKAWLYRVLQEIADDNFLASMMYFKGGTCASMLGWLDRFSVDLDFDFVGEEKQIKQTKKHLEKIFERLDLEIKDASQKALQYFLRYQVKDKNQRNNLKIDTFFPPLKGNKYEPMRLIDIDRIIYCQTIKTMFANKMVALIDRFKKGRSIAGRDLYDIHHYFLHGYSYDVEIMENYANKKIAEFLQELLVFIKEKITQKIIDQDINFLLTPRKFQQVRKNLKNETLVFLQDEIKRFRQRDENAILNP